MKSKRNSFYITASLMLFALGCLIGCSTLAKKLSPKAETGVVLARRAMVRSSYAPVAADLVTVNRGDQVDILDSDTADNGERWMRVRVHDEQSTEGWIEARNIMTQKVLDSTRELAQADANIPAQASGQLRASTNLRLSPDRSNNDNIIMRLESGSTFEIVGWKRVPKPKTSETTETDIAPKAGTVQQNTGRRRRGESDEQQEPEEINELWYKVKLEPSISPAPAGWIYGKQVELKVPSDIIFYRTGREFVAWRRLDEEADSNEAGTRDAAREAKPGSWVILERSNSNEPHRVDEPDFDRIYVLGYDKVNQEHYTAYRSPDIKGFLPLRLETQGGEKFFVIRVLGEDGQINEVRYKVYRDDRGLLKVTAMNEPPRERHRR